MNFQGKLINAKRVAKNEGIRSLIQKSAYFIAKDSISRYIWKKTNIKSFDNKHIKCLCEMNNCFFEYYDDNLVYSISPPEVPKSLSNSVERNWADIYPSDDVVGSPPFVCEIPDVQIIGPEAILRKNNRYLTMKGVSLTETHGLVLALSRGILPISDISIPTQQKFESVLPITGPLAKRYYHWFTNYLPRLEAFEYYCDKTGENPSLLIPNDPPEWIKTSLCLVGYGPETWIEWTGGSGSVESLIWPSLHHKSITPNHNGWIMSPSRYQWITTRIKRNCVPTQSISHSSHIYISREDAMNRHIRNETEVLNMIKKRGFEKYTLSHLSLEEQVTLFSNAEVIISPHGAGLTNMIYADNAIIIELIGQKRQYQNPGSYYRMANVLDHKYGCLECKVTDPDMIVNIDDLNILIQKLTT